jgi:uridine phosphorylase
MENKLQPHIKCKEGDIADIVFLVGDPGRIDLVIKYWDKAEKVADNRGYKGVPVSVISTGMGCPSAAIVVEELANVGVKKIIRIGTCGALKKEIKPGDIIIPTSAIREEGTTGAYVGPEVPAVADIELVARLESSAKSKNYRYWKGINRTHDAFYEPIENFLKLKGSKAISSEMECSAVFLIANLRGLKAAAVLAVNTTEPLDEIEKNPDLVYQLIEDPNAKDGVERAILTALDSVIE